MQCFEEWPEGRMQPKKILLANDMDLFLAVENTFFRRRQVTLLIANTGEEAYSLVEGSRPDLVFLDLTMEGMDGDACCRKIRKNPALRSIPVILITEGRRRQDLDRCCEAECDDVLVKPLDRQALLAVSRKFLPVTERTTPRVEARIRVQMRQDRRLQRGHTVNLSKGGLFLEIPAPAPVETKVTLRFSLPDSGTTIRCGGRVTWVNAPGEGAVPHLPVGMGVEFLDLRPREQEMIEGFVKRQFIAQIRQNPGP
jgi:uncharacterized protein (TIGR02266 family)